MTYLLSRDGKGYGGVGLGYRKWRFLGAHLLLTYCSFQSVNVFPPPAIAFAQALGLLEEMRSAGVEPNVVS